jgi:hypothetical protein
VVAGDLENVLKVERCVKEKVTIRCRVKMVGEGDYHMSSVKGVLIYGEAEKFEVSGKDVNIIKLPGTLVQAPDFVEGTEGDIILIVPKGAESVTLRYR